MKPNRFVVTVLLLLISSFALAKGWQFSMQTGTALHETGSDFFFAIVPNRDLVAIKKTGTGTASTEVHVLDASSSYQSFKLHTGTALHETGDNFAFGFLGNGDLLAIKKSGTGTNSTEVHILDAASRYQRFKLQTGTALHETGENFEFGVLRNGDVVAIKKNGTGSKTTEIHILSAASKYKAFRLQTPSALHETGSDFSFVILSNGDVMAVKKTGTGTKSTEVHILDASRNYQAFRVQSGTALHETPSGFQFSAFPNGELVAIKQHGTGTNSTEVHALKPYEEKKGACSCLDEQRYVKAGRDTCGMAECRQYCSFASRVHKRPLYPNYRPTEDCP